MTMTGVLFTAKQGDAASSSPIDQAPNGLLEGGSLGDAIISNVALGVVELLARRPATQRIAEEDIFEAAAAGDFFQHVPVELRSVSRIGRGARVDESIDAMVAQEPHEMLDFVVGMPDGKDRQAHGIAVEDFSRFAVVMPPF
jgi:hypothetical protein